MQSYSEPEVKQTAEEISEPNRPDHPLMEQLQTQFANSLMLYLNYKYYHWQVSGPLFRDLHLMFDEFAAEALEAVDEIAERIRMIGQDPLAIEQVRERALVKPTQAGRDPRAILQEADATVIQLIAETRRAALDADENGDPGTNDLLSGVVRTQEKHEWYFRELLKANEGVANFMTASRK